jgi:L-idonate 5-dehydrogenase
MAARLAGAKSVTVSDILDRPLAKAREVGADRTLRADREADALATPQFDVCFEVSGSFAALKSCVAAAKRGGTIVQVGTLPHEPLPFVVNELMAKELDLKGAFRWGIEFDWAVDYLSTRRVDVRPLLSGQFPLQEAVKAFALAKDKTQSTKVQVVAA